MMLAVWHDGIKNISELIWKGQEQEYHVEQVVSEGPVRHQNEGAIKQVVRIASGIRKRMEVEIEIASEVMEGDESQLDKW